ncbi:hypothetical protein VSS74_05835 [Conexibacter stalactiti]|uniref:Uncharacterized protein n=1 Tax=Conexibacter stalactiti TaxID=1940611 RepID=A0ABU4HKL2_9ACTN|nr:hypothetical protein [Conexibacter stalactiti]MDW5593844.1 hypothetical protein [Conexibacter stalactiti]MEC5034486.1 hypothetical protein [Conexibacter stalactiti]
MRIITTLLATVVAVLALTAAAASADVVRFDPGEGSFITDGDVGCIVGVTDAGRGTVTCAGKPVYAAIWDGVPCGTRTARGCVNDRRGGLLSIGLRERGRPLRDTIDGVGGAKGTVRGDAIALAGIRGRHLPDGGFSFRNRSGHGFTLTEGRLRRF